MYRTFLMAAALLAVTAAHATTLQFDASNTGQITGTGRTLSFALTGLDGEIRAARLELTLNYSRAEELGFELSDLSGGVRLPLSQPLFSGTTALVGRFQFSDAAITPFTAAVATGTLLHNVPWRSAQAGFNGGLCLNHLARYLEFDLRDGPTTTAFGLQLEVSRFANGGGGGTGSITGARLIVETQVTDRLATSGFDEPSSIPARCQHPVFDVVLNGGTESRFSSLSTYNVAEDGALTTGVRSFQPEFSVSGIAAGSATRPFPYLGRFGGRSRQNLGFWDAETGLLSFTTGAGGRSLELPGAWANVASFAMPGDYDGDGITDLAAAYLGTPHWVMRIRYSADDRVVDVPIDPRLYAPGSFNSGEIGFGAGQDANQDGRDEAFGYARNSAGSQSLLQFDLQPGGMSAVMFSVTWGQSGDRVVLGDWSTSSAGNQFGLMVVRPNGAQWEWYRFPDPNPVIFGQTISDLPVSLDADGDGLNDIAIYRRSTRQWFALQSSNGTQSMLGVFGDDAVSIPIPFVQGTIQPLQF